MEILKGCQRISIGIEEKAQKLHNLAEALETELTKVDNWYFHLKHYLFDRLKIYLTEEEH